MRDAGLPIRLPTVPRASPDTLNVSIRAGDVEAPETSYRSEGLNDLDLILAVQSGCDHSFDLLFARYWRLVFGIASRILKQRSEAEDVVQDVFLTIYLRSGSYDASRGSVRTWIAQFAHFKALVRRRSIHICDADNFDAFSEFEAGLLQFGKSEGVLERAALVQECLGLLNPRQRRTVELVHFDGYTLSETAAILNQSLANTRNLYYRGIHAMRTQLLANQPVPANDRHAVAPMPDAAVGSLTL